MKIAQVSPLYESVPPRLYGGTERIVHYLTEELVAQGHDVTLFASGDSKTSARLIPCCEKALRMDKRAIDQLNQHVRMLELVWQRSDEFDLIHFHVDYLHFPFSRRMRTPHVTTLHGHLAIFGLTELYQEFSDIPVVSISNAQRVPLPRANWLATVYHGLPPDLLQLNENPRGDYVAFVGRTSPEKQPDHAIKIARAAGIELRIAAKIDRADRRYFRKNIQPLLDEGDGVEFVGEINERQKQDFIGNARALLFPINWNEPFGLVMIEAFACGTPVIAYNCGSVPEVMIDGVTGCICNGLEPAIESMRGIDRYDRRQVRRVFDEKFTAARMTRDYLNIYQDVIEHRSLPHAEIA